MQLIKGFKAIVRVTGGSEPLGIQDQDFTWSGDDKDDVFSWAMNFADGYTTALMSGKEGIALSHPCVKQLDGYRWWTRGGFKVAVVNKDGKVVRKWEDLL